MKLFNSIKKYFNLMVMKILARKAKHKIVGPGKFKLTERGSDFAKYLMKVLSEEDYKADGYREYMFEEQLKNFCSDNNCSIKSAAYAHLLVIYSMI